MRGRPSKGNVFVGNLPPDFPDERLAETFDPYGIVLSAAVARDPDTGARLRYGFVDIATEKAATQAITALDGLEIDGCKLNVKARERAKKAPAGARPRRPSVRAASSNGASRSYATPARAMPAPAVEPPPRQLRSQSAQSQLAREGMPEIEPPPRTDFEVVRRPIRRGTPSFQVERRPLPRRV